jgi:hypothetical protein
MQLRAGFVERRRRYGAPLAEQVQGKGDFSKEGTPT